MKIKITASLLAIFTLIYVGINMTSKSYTETEKTLSALETAANGRVGVHGINTGNNKTIAFRANERFPLCSTNKIMGVGAALKQSENNKHFLDKVITYPESDLIIWSPITKKYLNAGMTNQALSRAAITHSDNTAINLLMKQLGGPGAITHFARTIGDNVFRLDRKEPELNTAIPGDLRDTSTPAAMVKSIGKLVLGDALAPKQRQLLKTWLINNTAGEARIRSAAPKSWTVGDKTGTCGHYGTTNDVAILWPKDSAPIILAIYYSAKADNAPPRDDVVANAARIALALLTKKKQGNNP